MKLGLIVLLVVCSLLVCEGIRTTRPKHRGDVKHSMSWASPYYFSQKVDHFDPLNNQTYQQKYYVDASNWKPNGPIFLFLGGEAPVEFFEFQTVLPRDLAKTFNALYIAIEHRFYGTSNPAQNYSTENLRFLSSRQALADAANFIVQFNKTSSYSSDQWIVWGCSYSGALSAWFRAKYPNLVIGSIAPSGPVQAKNNFTEYYNQFTTSVSYYEPDCLTTVQKGVQMISTLLSTASGRQVLSQLFNSCAPIADDPYDQYFFIYNLIAAVGSADQYDNPPLWPLNSTCSAIMSTSDIVSNWATIVLQQNLSANGQCIDYNETTGYLIPLQSVENENRSWLFQCCTEFGWWSTTYPGTSIFWDNQDVEHQLKWCSQIFGIENMQPDIDATNEYYGGFDLVGSNIMFTNGLMDPWHRISINANNGFGVDAVSYMDGHCATMIQPTDQDNASLIKARDVVTAFISGLLKA